MAKCERIEQTPTPPPPVYRLELSQDEADVLLDTFMRTSGAGRLRLWDEIGTALHSAGVKGKTLTDISQPLRFE